MELKIDKSFVKDTVKVNDAKLLHRLGLLLKHLQSVDNIHQAENLKRLAGKRDFYRIRLGNYRIGIRLKDRTLHLIRFLHRKDIYKYFPDV